MATGEFIQATGYVLHRRQLLEKTQLVDLFVLERGRVTALLKGSPEPTRRRKVSAFGRLQPFQMFSLRLKLKPTGLSRLGGFDEIPPLRMLFGKSLYAGLYLNELITRLLPLEEPSPELFRVYSESLDALAAEKNTPEPTLRCFERLLLEAIGYGINWQYEASLNDEICPDRHYLFVASQGFLLQPEQTVDTCSGAEIIAIRDGCFASTQTRRAAKRIMRTALEPHLDGKPLNSRSLFAPIKPAS